MLKRFVTCSYYEVIDSMITQTIVWDICDAFCFLHGCYFCLKLGNFYCKSFTDVYFQAHE